MKNALLVLCLMIAACSFKKSQLANQTQRGHHELYSDPSAPKEIEDGFKRIVIAATNDLQGHYDPHEFIFKDSQNDGQQSIKVGGINYLSSYFKILRQQYGQVLLVDSGDIFSARTQEASFVQDYYELLNYDAVTLGMRDFNLKLPKKYLSSADFFKDYSAKSKTPVILSNLYELKTARSVEWPGTLPYLLKDVQGVKVGIIGLIPDDIVTQTPVDNRVGLYVESMLQSTLRQARLLRSLGAEIIVVMTHQGLNCGEDLSQELNIPISKVNFEPQKSGICDLNSKLGEYLTRLPPQLVDVVIGGRNHQKVANYINSTLVMSGFEEGKSFTYVEFFIDSKTKKIARDRTIVHQPVMVCQEFFKESNDCYTEDSSVDHKVRTPAKFLDQVVEPDTSFDHKFHFYLDVNKKTSAKSPINFQSALDIHQAQVAYYNESNGSTHLVKLSVSGKALIQILEEEYNQDKKTQWIPSPFREENEVLHLSIQGSEIQANETYSVLADLEDIQKHPLLKKYLIQVGSQTLASVSWTDLNPISDDVTTAMAASDTVR